MEIRHYSEHIPSSFKKMSSDKSKMVWKSQDLPSAFKSLKANCESMFDGPLKGNRRNNSAQML